MRNNTDCYLKCKLTQFKFTKHLVGSTWLKDPLPNPKF